MLAGNNGILNRATQAKEATRGGEVQETVKLAATSNVGVEYIGGTKKTRVEVINELHEKGKLTDEEINLLTDEDNPVDVITIGGITIDFSVLGNTRMKSLGEAYDSGNLVIGDTLTYSSNGQSNWIVFGKDKNGNILITTDNPIENAFTLHGGAEAWLKYESDTDSTYGLNKACSIYGGTIQGTPVHSRSIKREDINYVVGLNQKTININEDTYNIQSFDTYTFGSVPYSETNKTVNYWYPILTGGTGANGNGTGFWKEPTSENETTFDNKWYWYYCNWDNGQYYYYGVDLDGRTEISATDIGLNINNLKYVWGGNTEETCYKDYLVASRSVQIYPESSTDNVYFSVDYVGSGQVKTNHYGLCYSNSDGGYDYDVIGSSGIRPVVVLPYTLLVEEQESGKYDLAE